MWAYPCVLPLAVLCLFRHCALLHVISNPGALSVLACNNVFPCPCGNGAFPRPLFQIPPFQFDLFRKDFDFQPLKFLTTFFSHWPQTLNVHPYFPCLNTFPPISRNFSFPPTFPNCPPLFRKIYVFYILLCVFRFPLYFDHDGFMHHTMHVLDAPGYTKMLLHALLCGKV